LIVRTQRIEANAILEDANDGRLADINTSASRLDCCSYLRQTLQAARAASCAHLEIRRHAGIDLGVVDCIALCGQVGDAGCEVREGDLAACRSREANEQDAVHGGAQREVMHGEVLRAFIRSLRPVGRSFVGRYRVQGEPGYWRVDVAQEVCNAWSRSKSGCNETMGEWGSDCCNGVLRRELLRCEVSLCAANRCAI
jgi:hypothetical protein